MAWSDCPSKGATERRTHRRAATPGARVCDPQQSPEAGAAVEQEWILAFEGRCGSQTRAPSKDRGLPQFGDNLTTCSSALQQRRGCSEVSLMRGCVRRSISSVCLRSTASAIVHFHDKPRVAGQHNRNPGSQPVTLEAGHLLTSMQCACCRACNSDGCTVNAIRTHRPSRSSCRSCCSATSPDGRRCKGDSIDSTRAGCLSVR